MTEQTPQTDEFADFAPIPESQSGEFRKTEYTKIQPGVTLQLRILDKSALHVVKHWIPRQKLSVLCLGEDVCPVCINNQKLINENPGMKYRQIPGFIARQNRFMVNVLNKTLAKVTATGNVVYPVNGQYPTNDPVTGEPITSIEPRPLNRVEILERGPTLFSQFNAINRAVTDEAGNPLGLWKYDVAITATGQGRKMTTNVIPYPQHNKPVEVEAEELYNLESQGIMLSPDEMWKLLAGTSLSDVYAERRVAEEAAVSADLARLGGDAEQEVQQNLGDLFDA